MRLRKRPACPPEFGDGVQVIADERAAAIAHFEGGVGDRPEYKAYKRAGPALNELFGGKCAYCESRVLGGSPTHVEHFRPAKEVHLQDGARLTGYWWLASAWSNLVPACFDCNTRHKRNFFPLEDEHTRARGPGEESHEVPFLLDPCGADDPDLHLEFLDDGVIRALSEMGKASIRIYGLSRKDLTTNREMHLDSVDNAIWHVKRAVEAVDGDPDDMAKCALLGRELEELKLLLREKVNFIAMTKQRMRAELPAQICELLGLST
jgi:uncharacterized protein (TIGR02646 family)